MKANKLRTLWIIFLSLLATAKIAWYGMYRHIAGTVNRAWVNKTIQRWADHVLNLAGIKYELINPHDTKPLPGKATIVMCNHSSLYDIPLSFKIFPQCSMRMLGKIELSKIPVFGKAMYGTEFPFIDRHNRRQAIQDLKLVQELLESGIVMWIAPEGTRSKTGKLGAFKKGAFITAIQTNATIIPVGIRGANQILPARTFQLNLNQEAEIHIGKAIDATNYTLNNKEELIAEVFATMKQLVGEA